MKKPSNYKADIDFLYEMGSIRFISRMWTRFLGGNFANLAEHHFRVFWIAMVIAKYENADSGKVAKLVMVHDIAESRTGDVDYLARQYVERHEEMGIKDMLSGTSLEEEFMELWYEYEKRESLESRVVKDADNLDVDFELIEQASIGNQLQNTWQEKRQFVANEKLFTETAKRMVQQILVTNPHGWHLHGRNRINDGDWKK